MAEQILSQDEIDALLGAMAKGDVAAEEGPDDRGPKVTPYDLTSKSVMVQDEFSVLEEVYDRFIRLSRRKLSSELRRPINVELVSTEGVSFHDFMQGFSFPTSFNFFSMAPLCERHTVWLQIYVRNMPFGERVPAAPDIGREKEGRVPTQMEAEEAGMFFSIKPYHAWKG